MPLRARAIVFRPNENFIAEHRAQTLSCPVDNPMEIYFELYTLSIDGGVDGGIDKSIPFRLFYSIRLTIQIALVLNFRLESFDFTSICFLCAPINVRSLIHCINYVCAKT